MPPKLLSCRYIQELRAEGQIGEERDGEQGGEGRGGEEKVGEEMN